MSTFREISKRNWEAEFQVGTDNCKIEHINVGSLQRIADALEGLVKIKALEEDRDYYKGCAHRMDKDNQKLRREIAKLKKQP